MSIWGLISPHWNTPKRVSKKTRISPHTPITGDAYVEDNAVFVVPNPVFNPDSAATDGDQDCEC